MENKKVEILKALAGNLLSLVAILDTEYKEVTNTEPVTLSGSEKDIKVIGIDKARGKSKTVKSTMKVTPEKVEVIEEEVVEEEIVHDLDELDGEGAYTLEELEAMKYNEVKKLCKELELDTKGTKDVLVERLMTELEVEVEEVEDEPEVEEEVVETEEENESNVEEQVEEAVKDMTIEEIGEVLIDVKLSAKGKRQALIARLVKAVEDGLISFEDDEEEEPEVEEPEVEETEEVETVEEDYFPEDMTEDRKTVMTEIEKELKADLKAKDIPDKEIKELNEKFYLDHEGYESKLSKREKFEMYVEALLRLIDDEGEQHDLKETYVMNGESACCGHYLKVVDDNFVCEVCGTEYECEEE